MNIVYPDRKGFKQRLEETDTNSLDFIVIITAAFGSVNIQKLKIYLDECMRVLKEGGVLFVQGRPEYLPELGIYLDCHLNFKYWIAIESTIQHRESGLPSVHAAVLLFTKGNDRFNVKRTRFPHQHCAYCERTLKDWGGKAHLMHPDGYVISDVWKDLPQANNYTQLSPSVLNAILQMLDFESPLNSESSSDNTPTLFQQIGVQIPAREGKGLVGPKEGIADTKIAAEPAVQYHLPNLPKPDIMSGGITKHDVEEKMFNVVHHGDAVEVLKHYPDNSVDLVFADPPYNLDKAYHVYDDERADKEYIKWCNSWLREYVRILKPTGSLYVLNLPRWTMYHAAFLNQYLYFQNWVVWDAMAAPLGKVMPAHYGLLFYTKHPTDFTFNYDKIGQLDARYYCLRRSCIRKRKAAGVDDKMSLTDIWWDIHRIKHRRDRDSHPCQLPGALMERIIRLSTNKGDCVLDALCGTGETLIAAIKLERRYVGIDIDQKYVEITKKKLAEIELKGYVERQSVHKPQRKYTKKELQLELRNLAVELERLPTPEDVRKMSRYDLDFFLDTFPTWGKALKAAKLEVQA